MDADFQAAVLRNMIYAGQLDMARAYAAERLREGNINQAFANAVADFLEAKPRRGAPENKGHFEIATTVFHALPRERRYGDLKAAFAVAEREHGCTREVAKKAYEKWREPLEANEKLEAELRAEEEMGEK